MGPDASTGLCLKLVVFCQFQAPCFYFYSSFTCRTVRIYVSHIYLTLGLGAAPSAHPLSETVLATFILKSPEFYLNWWFLNITGPVLLQHYHGFDSLFDSLSKVDVKFNMW